ncbi:hypothetical protein [Agrobacterium tumefaciens]|uniref:hypothetical protein n=1 Tax=Agrobacterium tumefaciens TaxID=358 RepID=UPI00287C1E75|nr:hypothetical protein [Agrobacterium tumefaciens]MDS7598370.1 hypothetical protein [Agrobacterium tumefaciens]
MLPRHSLLPLFRGLEVARWIDPTIAILVIEIERIDLVFADMAGEIGQDDAGVQRKCPHAKRGSAAIKF